MKEYLKKLTLLAGVRNAFIFLLPVFFVLHGFNENYDYIGIREVVLLTIQYLLIAIAIMIVCRLLFADRSKADIFTFFLLCIYFLFGSLHDTLKDNFPETLVTRYAFLLPFLLILAIFIIILLKRKHRFSRLRVFLNVLLVVFLIIEVTSLLIKASKPEDTNTVFSNSKGLHVCGDCQKPDVYLIIVDEYSGYKPLKEIFHFDNSPFYNKLSERGFRIINNSVSNYSFTTYSMASILNIDFLPLTAKELASPLTELSMKQRMEEIENNILVDFFEEMGYDFYNHSIFNMHGKLRLATHFFNPYGADLIRERTFTNRLRRHIGFHMVEWGVLGKPIKKLLYKPHRDNLNILEKTVELSATNTLKPKFVYAHLTLPHYPYYFNKEGTPYPINSLREGEQVNMEHYLEYLQYSNGVLIEFIDNIRRSSKKPVAIILLGDHGFRFLPDKVKIQYKFHNLAALMIPGKNQNEIPDSISNVNILRSFLNIQFNQNLSMVPDSIIISNEEEKE